MSRGFLGSRNGTSTTGTSSFRKKRSAKDIFMQKMSGELSDSELTPEERYQKILREKMASMTSEINKSSRYGVMLPGTENSSQERKMSKTTEAFIQKMAEKKAKDEAKKIKQRRKLDVVPKMYAGPQGGKIDSEGRIWAPGNKVVAKVDFKTGYVVSAKGSKICKFANSSFCEFRIAQFIAKETANAKPFSPWGTAAMQAPAKPANIWSTFD